MTILVALSGSILLAVPSDSRAEMYQYVDAKGTISLTNVPLTLDTAGSTSTQIGSIPFSQRRNWNR